MSSTAAAAAASRAACRWGDGWSGAQRPCLPPPPLPSPPLYPPPPPYLWGAAPTDDPHWLWSGRRQGARQGTTHHPQPSSPPLAGETGRPGGGA
ncbi:hypothetical protein I4F81_012166 [Pyropia yezoensis]|uniref:Uncharacterized protein n=1 Tax=Pyropia yezoensis TaxID=2788 RepID=A0ACC3CIY5_PYRYE|nr:hypothetical protein I4F81_012166 [Neopyropia yezoensis]